VRGGDRLASLVCGCALRLCRQPVEADLGGIKEKIDAPITDARLCNALHCGGEAT